MNRYRLTDKLIRYRHIVRIVTKYGFGIIVEKTHLSKIFRIPVRKKKREDLSAPVRVRKMLEELGPTFVKLGQILSTRPDLVPLPYIKELENLQDNTYSFPFEMISGVFLSETGKRIEDVFSDFEEIPFASASISQVHKAAYRGKKVAVKIQKPGIEDLVQVDMAIMYDIAGLIEKFIKEAEIYRPVNIVREFEKALERELDFSLEARNIERFRKNFESEPGVLVPMVYFSVSTRRVLTLEFVGGIKINRIDELDRAGIDRKKISEIGLASFMKQIFVDGFFHADPHPANLLVTSDCRLCFIDFGIVGRISEERRLEIAGLLRGLTEGNISDVMESLESMGALKEDTDSKGFREEMEEMLDRYKDMPIKDIDVNRLIEEVFSLMRRYHIWIPSNFTLLVKTLATLEGIGLSLNPDFSLSSGIKPYLARVMFERMKINNLFKDFLSLSSAMSRIVREFPSSLDSFLKMIRKGYINIAFEHKGLHDLISTIDKASNRLSFSLIIAALIISSALIMVSGAGPFILGYPALGVVGFVVSAIFGIGLIIDIVRHRNM